MAGLSTITDGDVDTRSVLDLEVAKQEAFALFEADHCSRVEGLFILLCKPPAGTLSVDDRCFSFTFYDNIRDAFSSVFAANENNLAVWSLAVFH